MFTLDCHPFAQARACQSSPRKLRVSRYNEYLQYGRPEYSSSSTSVDPNFVARPAELIDHSVQTNGADALEETLARLSKKPGVKATIALDRSSGAILKTAGQISLLHTAKSQTQQQQQQQTQPDDPNAAATTSASSTDNETQGAEELAGMVWAFVNAAGGLVEGLDAEVSWPTLHGVASNLGEYRCSNMMLMCDCCRTS